MTARQQRRFEQKLARKAAKKEQNRAREQAEVLALPPTHAPSAQPISEAKLAAIVRAPNSAPAPPPPKAKPSSPKTPRNTASPGNSRASISTKILIGWAPRQAFCPRARADRHRTPILSPYLTPICDTVSLILAIVSSHEMLFAISAPPWRRQNPTFPR